MGSGGGEWAVWRETSRAGVGFTVDMSDGWRGVTDYQSSCGPAIPWHGIGNGAASVTSAFDLAGGWLSCRNSTTSLALTNGVSASTHARVA